MTTPPFRCTGTPSSALSGRHGVSTTIDNCLLEIPARPLCKGMLQHGHANNELICHVDKLAYLTRGDIPAMLIDEARQTVKGTPVDST